MKKIYIIALAATMTMSLTRRNDFLDYTPTAVVNEDKAFSDPEKMVNSAYAMLGDCWYSYPFNLWPYGDLASDDCLKGGGGTGDTGYHDIEVWSSLTSTRGEARRTLVPALLCRVALQPRPGVSRRKRQQCAWRADHYRTRGRGPPPARPLLLQGLSPCSVRCHG